MRLPKFEYIRPSTIEEACSFLSEHRQDTRVLSGGTALMVDMGQRLLAPKYVLGLKGLADMDYVRYDGKSGLRIGALTTLETLSSSSLIANGYDILRQACESAAAPPLRSMATIGGNLSLDTRCLYYNQSDLWRKSRPLCLKLKGDVCHAVRGGRNCLAVYQGDLAAALMALGSQVRLVKKGGERVVPLSQFFTRKGEKPNILEPDDMVAEIQVPPAAKKVGVYQKLRVREAIDFPLASVAVVMSVTGDKVCQEASVVLGAVGPAPLEVPGAGQILLNKKVDDRLVEQAAQEAYDRAHPIDNLAIDPEYRRKMIRVLTKRAINQALVLAGARS